MLDLRRVAVGLLAAILLCGMEATANPCALPDNAAFGEGMGGTGVFGPGEDDGMGGTGLADEGMGGTGHVDEGLGGTGNSSERPEARATGGDGMGGTGVVAGSTIRLLGTITAFGSVCVNGERVSSP